jgi:hypothetical protein
MKNYKTTLRRSWLALSLLGVVVSCGKQLESHNVLPLESNETLMGNYSTERLTAVVVEGEKLLDWMKPKVARIQAANGATATCEFECLWGCHLTPGLLEANYVSKHEYSNDLYLILLNANESVRIVITCRKLDFKKHTLGDFQRGLKSHLKFSELPDAIWAKKSNLNGREWAAKHLSIAVHFILEEKDSKHLDLNNDRKGLEDYMRSVDREATRDFEILPQFSDFIEPTSLHLREKKATIHPDGSYSRFYARFDGSIVCARSEAEAKKWEDAGEIPYEVSKK